MSGGRGSSKTETAARKIYKRCKEEGNHRFLIMRKVRKTLKDSVIKVMTTLLDEMGDKYSYNKSDRLITFFSPDGKKNELLFEGMDDPEKLKSIKGITSVWIEELTEFTELEFMQIDLILREPTGHYHQIMTSFNPDEARAVWPKEMFFDNIHPDAFVHESTIEDNPIKEVRDSYRKTLDAIKDPVYRKIYRKGEWALAKGIIFDWDVVKLPNIKFDEIFHGGDHGFSVNPAGIVRIYRKGLEFWVEEILYKTGLTNPDLAKEIKSNPTININAPFYFDSAEPKSNEELFRLGINVHPSTKGPDSVRAGIDLLKSLDIHIVEGSQNLINERKGYKWKEDKDGKPLPEPVKFNDHLIDPTRYAIYTHFLMYLADYKKGKVHKDTKIIPVTPEELEEQAEEREELVLKSVERSRMPPDYKGKLPIDRAQSVALMEYTEHGAVNIKYIMQQAEVEEIVARNALSVLGLNEINGTGDYDKQSLTTKGEIHGRRKGRVHV